MIPGKLTLTPFCIAAALVFGGASMAEAGWSRSGGGTGAYGRSWSSSGQGSCAYGACSSSQAFTGPTWSDCNAQWKLELLGRILQFLRDLDGTWRPKRDAQRLY